MAEDELELNELELHTIQRCKHRLQDLFHVTVATSFVTLQNDGTPSKVRLFTSQSQENIEKAKVSSSYSSSRYFYQCDHVVSIILLLSAYVSQNVVIY